jgi:hypothetical protein
VSERRRPGRWEDDMMAVATIWLACLAIFLELAERAPTIEVG